MKRNFHFPRGGNPGIKAPTSAFGGRAFQRRACIAWIPLLLLLVLPAVMRAQWDYTTNNGAIILLKYTGPGGSVTISDSTNGYPVTRIGDQAFYACSSLTDITIPNSVTNIGEKSFYYCRNLTNVTIPASVTSIGTGAFEVCFSLPAINVSPLNPAYTSLDGVLFDKAQSALLQYPAGKAGTCYTITNSVASIGTSAFSGCTNLTRVTIPDGVTNMGDYVFQDCWHLVSIAIPDRVPSLGKAAFNWDVDLVHVTIGDGVTNIGDYALEMCSKLTTVVMGKSVAHIGNYAIQSCDSLKQIYFKGNAPSLGSSPFGGDNNATVYYLPGTTNWGATLDNLPAVLWNPQAQTSVPGFGVQNNQFGFNITGSSNLVVVVEACVDSANPLWFPIATNILTGGSSYFSDPEWTNYPARFYRFRAP